MFETFYPGNYVDSAYEIPYEKLYERGYRGIIFDVDNTLVPHGAPADKRAIELFERLRAIGFSTCILSNNKEPRVERMKTDRDTTFFVGDQLFTDVWGANRTGLYSILVKPINPKEEIQIVLKRYLEAVVLMFYRKRLKKTGRTAGDFCKK